MALGSTTRLLAVFSLSLTGLVTAQAADHACHDALVVDQWQPFVALVGGDKNADDTDKALNALADVIATQRLIITSAKPDDRAAALRSKLWNGVRDYDLNKLYEALPVAEPPWRAAYFISRPAGSVYRISVADTPRAAIDTLGAARTALAARPDQKKGRGDAFTLKGGLDSNIGPISWRGTRRALGLGLLHSASPADISAPAAAQQAAHEAFPELAKPDRPLMAQLWYGLPATWAWYASIGRVEQLRGAPADNPAVHHLHYQVALDGDELHTRYPGVDGYLAKLGNLVEARVRVTSPAGQWVVFSMDSGARQLVVDVWIDDAGHLVPTRGDTPRPSAALGDDPRAGAFTTHVDATMRAYGLIVAFDDLTTQWRFDKDGRGAHFVGRINEVPKTVIRGRAFGVLPAGMLDALMPSDMASFAEQFMQRLADSDAGRGARIVFDVTDRGADNRMAFAGEGDLLDNFFVRFGVKMMNGRVLPDSDQLADIRRVVDDGLGRFEQDRQRRVGLQMADTGCSIR